MKKLLFIATTTLISLSLLAQEYKPLNVKEWPESDSNTKFYTVSGYRHGVSFFPQIRQPDVQYEAGDVLTFDTFHTIDVMNSWMIKWAEEYPDLVDLYQVAESYEGRPILQMTITNKNTGKDTDKPSAYFEGNRHSGEVTAAESVLWLINHLLTGYGNDPEITKLLDTKTIYARPVNNPDGHNLYMHTAQSNRSTVRPYDSDNDGLLDEDSPEDLDGDGMILQVRWKDDKTGNAIPDPDDPSGRIMKRVPEGEGTYRLESEGIDNDGDGRINEDGIGGLDLHRNYVENWRPMEEATGRGYTQDGAGEYPLSENETRSVVTFLLSHPNVYVVNSMDTRVPMHLRPPSTSSSEDRMYPDDLKWYEYFDEMGKSITGYTRAGDVYDDYGHGNPLFGHGPDFGYFYYGAIWYGDEIWNGAQYKDYDGDGDIDDIDLLRWDDEENDGQGFIEWKEGDHPVYGKVEYGGFNPKFFSQNPPAKHLEEWARNEALFNLSMVKHLPELEWGSIDIKKQKGYRSDSTDYRITVNFVNKGQLPTALKQAYLVKIVREDQVSLSFGQDDVAGDKPAIKILTEEAGGQRRGRRYGSAGNRVRNTATLSAGFTDGGKTTSVVFEVRTYGDAEVTGKATVSSTRGGVLTPKEFKIGNN